MQTATAIYEEIKTTAETNKCDTPVRIALQVGQHVRQGDLYVMRIEELPPVVKTKQQLQIVPGDTMGSRHCLDSLEHITLHDLKNKTVLDGPVIESRRTEFSLLHPEHGDIIFEGAGVYRTGYQKAYAQELRRRMD